MGGTKRIRVSLRADHGRATARGRRGILRLRPAGHSLILRACVGVQAEPQYRARETDYLLAAAWSPHADPIPRSVRSTRHRRLSDVSVRHWDLGGCVAAACQSERDNVYSGGIETTQDILVGH
jgi:hypothetical protein